MVEAAGLDPVQVWVRLPSEVPPGVAQFGQSARFGSEMPQVRILSLGLSV